MDAHDTSSPIPRAVLLDALGTLVGLDDPVGGVRAALAWRGIRAAPAEVGAALRREMAFYRAEHHRASDRAGLEALRDDCAGVLARALPAAAALPAGEVRAALLEGLRFRVYPEVPAALDALASRGVRLVVVSNWDVSLHDVLADTGLAGRFDAVLTSAEERVAKPDGAIFRRALDRAGGIAPADALHAGDDLETDVRGALAAGLRAVLVDRAGGARAPRGVPVVGGLGGLPGAAR
jgi:HAD superfamily hydrolase (TIGR01549 family)